MSLIIEAVDYHNVSHGETLVRLLNDYASDPAGGSTPLPDEAYAHLPERLAQIPWAFSRFARADGRAIGLVNCFEGFSTFACRPLVNVHDLIVHDDYRGQGVAQKLLQAVETEAIARGCCKITLEVLEHNHPARAAYRKFGFQGYELDPAMGQAIFLQKKLALSDR